MRLPHVETTQNVDLAVVGIPTDDAVAWLGASACHEMISLAALRKLARRASYGRLQNRFNRPMGGATTELTCRTTRQPMLRYVLITHSKHATA
jgi:hypothetical protein